MNSYSASIEIGGSLHARDIGKLLVACEGSHVGLDWNTASLIDDDTSLEQLSAELGEATAEKRPLRLFNDSATNGRLDDLETFCRVFGLTYMRQHDPDNGDSGLVSWWTTGMDEPVEKPADADGEALVYVSALNEAIEAADDDAGRLDAVLAILDASTPVTVPALVLVG